MLLAQLKHKGWVLIFHTSSSLSDTRNITSNEQSNNLCDTVESEERADKSVYTPQQTDVWFCPFHSHSAINLRFISVST